MFFEGRKILFISLTRTGSVEYAAALAEKLGYDNLFVIASEESSSHFKKVDVALRTYTNKATFLLQSLTIKKRLSKIINESIGSSANEWIVLFPVFHPWNNIIANISHEIDVQSACVIHDYEMHIGERNKKVEYLQQNLIQRVGHVIFLTHFERLKAIDKGLDESKTSVWPHPLLPTSKVNTLIHSKRLKILYLGRIKKYKGVELLIEAVSDLDIELLTIAGEGKIDVQEDSGIQLINKRLSNSEIDDLLSNHHVLVLPYIDASQSGILTLGISANIPMIISDLPGLREQIDANAAIWCAPNVIDLRRSILEYQESEIRYDIIKENMRLYQKIFAEKMSDYYFK